MGQEHLVIFGRQGSHHQTEYNEKRANGDEGLQITLVENGTDNYPSQEKQESLYCADP